MNDEIFDNTCATCGIVFSFSKKIEKLWRDSHKTFFCPNGHSLLWSGPTADEKQLISLRKEVKELTATLASMTLKVAEETKMIEALTAELEIWKPSDW